MHDSTYSNYMRDVNGTAMGLSRLQQAELEPLLEE